MADRTTETKVELAGQPAFDSLNPYGETLEFLDASSPTELRAMLRQIRLETKIINIYAYGSRHVAWIMTRAKIKKKGK